MITSCFSLHSAKECCVSLTCLHSYRSFHNEHATKIAEGFIDGDLVEQFLDLAPSDMADICKGIKVSSTVCVSVWIYQGPTNPNPPNVDPLKLCERL